MYLSEEAELPKCESLHDMPDIGEMPEMADVPDITQMPGFNSSMLPSAEDVFNQLKDQGLLGKT